MSIDKHVVAIALGQTVVWSGLFYTFPALLLRWEHSIGWSKSSLTGAISIALLLSAVAAPLAGRFIDAGKGPITMTASVLLGGLALFIVAYAEQLWQFYFCWGVIGITFAGCLYEPCFALVTRARGQQARHSIINITLIAGFASSIAFPVANSLTDAYGWQAALQFFAAIVVLAGAPLIWYGANGIEQSAVAKPEAQTRHSGISENHNRLLQTPVFWCLAIGFALLGVVNGVTLHHLLSILSDRGLNSNVAIIAAAFIGPMQVAGRLLIMACTQRVSNHGIATSCFVAMAVAIIVLSASAIAPVLLVSFIILFGGGYGMLSIARPLITRDILGAQNFGVKSGAVATLYLSGTAIAPWLGALIWAQGGYDLVLAALIALAMTGLLLYIAAHRISRASASSKM